MKKLMSLVIVLMMLTTINNYANTAVPISETIQGDENTNNGLIKKENTILKGDFIKYESNTLFIQLEQYDDESSLYDADGTFEKTISNYTSRDEIIVYAAYGESTFHLLDVLPKDTKVFNGQIQSIQDETYDILSGDTVEEYRILNNDQSFVEEQFVKGYVHQGSAYLMPTINLSNQQYDSFGKLIEKNIIINDEILSKNGISMDSHLMIPLRETLESLGYEVKWNNDTRSVDLHQSNQWTSIKIGENSYFKNKMAPHPLSHAPIIVDGSTYIPVEFLNVILDLGLSVNEGHLTVSKNQMAIHHGFIQKIDYKVQGEISITISSKEMPNALTDLTIIHASKDTTYFNTTLKQGQLIHIISPPIMTMSLPGQTSGVVIY